jgi:(2R)-3-sulfolactate dehydrogenase (NADP+)
MAGRYSMQMADAGLIGHVVTNTPAVMPAFGGHTVRIGNNPLSWAFPRRGHRPIVLDMAVSAAARGKIRLAAAANQPIPEGWAVDDHGRPTVDATAAMAGALAPVGGPKGYGLAVVNEVLAGALSGARVLTEVSTRTVVTGDLHDEWGVGQFLLAVDPSVMTSRDDFDERVETMCHLLADDVTEDGSAPRLPGDPEHERERVSDARGIDLPSPSLAAVAELEASTGVLLPREQ